MKNVFLVFACALIMASCGEREVEVAFTISEKDLIPEGIAYSTATGAFFVGSIYRCKIVKIDDKTLQQQDFVAEEVVNASFLGMMVDDERGLLWACGNSPGEAGLSSVYKFDLLTGKLLKQYSGQDSAVNLYNDLTIDIRGDVYFTNSNGQRVYKIDTQADSVTVFHDGEDIRYPNGITISPDSKYLYVASHTKGIRVIDIARRQVKGEPDTTFVTRGIDGLKFHNNSLIGVQNALDKGARIVRFDLDETLTRITGKEVIDEDHASFEIPTTAVVKDDHLYCVANSQLRKLDFEKHEIIDTAKLNRVVVLKYPLK